MTLTFPVITADPLYTQGDTSQLILSLGEYVLTVKGHQETLRPEARASLAPCRATDQDRSPIATMEKGHGPSETQTMEAVSVSPGEVHWPGVAQVFYLTGGVLQKGKDTFDIVYLMTSLTREDAE